MQDSSRTHTLTTPSDAEETLAAPDLVRAEPRLGRFRPTFAVVDLGRLAHNFRALAARVGHDVAQIPVVKADGYGHGGVVVARRLAAEGASAFGVALVEEGVELRRAGLREPILLLGVLTPGQVASALEHDLTPAVFEPSLLERLEEEGRARGRRLAVNVKIDTGMGRLGFPVEEQEGLVRRLAASRGLELAGVFTTFSTADDPQSLETGRQIDRLDAFVSRLSAAGLGPGLVHAANSAAILSHPRGWKGAVRPGLALYGLHPGEKVDRADLRPVLAFETTVIQVRDVPEGGTVGYGGAWRATRASRVAILPVGYADGWPRALSNRGRVLFEGGAGIVAGRVSMDLTAVDVTALGGVETGGAATLIGERGGAALTATDLAEATGTIAYEVLCGIGRRVPRVYVEAGRVVEFSDPLGVDE
jgi:alanine racemase